MPLVDEVLGNLVGNACRYAAGEVVLEVRVRAAGDGAALELTVADDGPGFSAEALRHGCDAFFARLSLPSTLAWTGHCRRTCASARRGVDLGERADRRRPGNGDV